MEETDVAARRAVRGIPLEVEHESPELADLRRFEVRAFPRRGMANEPASVPPETFGLDAAFIAKLKVPDLPSRWDPRVLRYLQFYKDDPRGRAIMTTWLKRQGRFRLLIEDALARHDVPHALLYVAMIESGYQPKESSSAGAAGIWQFMESGGRVYGLDQDYWRDDRRNPERATEAAALYFRDLFVRFGHWHLALAAYNAGYGAVLTSMQRFGTNDFWELCKHESGLPWETCLYVPKAIAAAIVGLNREAFGFGEVVADPPWTYDRASVPSGVPLSMVSKLSGISMDDLTRLNPELRRGRTPPGPARSYPLRVPPGKGSAVRAKQSELQTESDQYDTHALRFGERLDDVGRKRHVANAILRRINQIVDTTAVAPGTLLLVPKHVRPEEAWQKSAEEDSDLLLVAVPNRPFAYPNRKRLFYRTRDGDSVASVANFFHVTTSEVAQWNQLEARAKLVSKMVLQLFVPNDVNTDDAMLLPENKVRAVALGTEEFFRAAAAKKGKRRITYVCRAGDTLATVGRRFGLTSGDLARINQIVPSEKLSAGRTLVVYQPVIPAAKSTKPASTKGGGPSKQHEKPSATRHVEKTKAAKKSPPRKSNKQTSG